MTKPTTPSARRRLIIRRIRITGWTALSALLTTIIGFLAWAHVIYVADRQATLEVFRAGTVTVDDRNRAVIITPAESQPEGEDTVMVFYPGGRVDPYSYLPPLAHLSETTGVRVVIARVPLNLALTDTRDVTDLASLAGEFDGIVVAGHSLGGVQACLKADHPQVSHLILLAGYCANDLGQRNTLQVLTLLGSEDALTDIAQVNDASALLPDGASLVTIEGANHASFGAYGPQSGDGIARIGRTEAASLVVAEIALFLGGEDR